MDKVLKHMMLQVDRIDICDWCKKQVEVVKCKECPLYNCDDCMDDESDPEGIYGPTCKACRKRTEESIARSIHEFDNSEFGRWRHRNRDIINNWEEFRKLPHNEQVRRARW